MLIVYPDTNAIFSDSLLTSEPSVELLAALSPGAAELHVSPVVVAEAARHHRDRVAEDSDGLRARLDRLGRLAGVDSAAAVAATDTLAGAATAAAARRWDEILAMPGVVGLPWPDVPLRALVERELARRRPFLDVKDGTVGQRDAVIWLGLLELAVSRPGDDIVFLTADGGFLDGKRLHPDLVEDLTALGAASVPRILRSLHAVRPLVDAAAASARASAADGPAPDAGGDEGAWRRAAVVEAVHDFCQSLPDLAWIPEHDPRDGGLEPPLYDADLPPQLTEAHVVEVAGPLRTVVEDDPARAGASLARFVASLYFDGFVDKSDWNAGEVHGVDLWDADWNDHVVNVVAGRELHFEASVVPDQDRARVERARLVKVEKE